MLTDIKIKSATRREKSYKLTDGQGLYLQVTPTGGKWWRFKYRFNGKEKLLSFGTYPEVSLADAREKRDTARKQVANNIDPSQARKARKQSVLAASENGFEVVAREWHDKFRQGWSKVHADTTIRRLERNVFPWLGTRPIGEIKAPELLAVLRRIEERGAQETAHRIKTICGQVFRYAISTGRAERDWTTDLKGALPPARIKHLAAVTDLEDVARLLRVIDGYQGSIVTRCALQLAPLVFVRPGELRQAEWAEINFDTAEWNIPAERMKMKHAHLVPLSRQAVAILRELRPLTGSDRYVFPSMRSSSRPMSNNAINAALRRMGYKKDEMTGHGFRAMARTILDEVLHVRPEYIEHQLAHAVRDPNGRAYNRTAHLDERKRMMQLWADYLDEIKAGAKILPLPKMAG
jgi:integrase